MQGNIKNKMIPSSENKFFIKNHFVPIKFEKIKNKIISFTVNVAGKKTEFLKID